MFGPFGSSKSTGGGVVYKRKRAGQPQTNVAAPETRPRPSETGRQSQGAEATPAVIGQAGLPFDPFVVAYL